MSAPKVKELPRPPRSGYLQTVEIKSWTGTVKKVDCDDDLNALALFAAAPEMLDLLMRMNLRLADRKHLSTETSMLFAEMRALIAKATGGTK